MPQNSWTGPMTIDACQIGLPTGGAIIDSVEVRDKGCVHWRVDGRILSLDPAAEPIIFRVLMPCEGWNRKLLQVGGGGFNGTVPLMMHAGIGDDMWYGQPAPVAQGYVVFGSDSGHVAPRAYAENWADESGADFALNDEMRANFAHESVKKVHDVAATLAHDLYGCDYEHCYYCGTSNGGREGLMAIQRYGADYDGVICGYPAIHWIPMALYGLRVGDAEAAAGEDGFIGPEDWARAFAAITKANDGLDGIEDGIISSFYTAGRKNPVLRATLMQLLSPAQLRLVDTAAADMDISYLGKEDFEEYPGFAVMQGEPLRDDDDLFVLNGLSSAPGANDSSCAKFGHAVISRMVMQDAGFDTTEFDPEDHVDALRRASDLLDADSTNWDDFVMHGGKAIMYHGTYDQLISVKATVQYYEALCDRYDRERALEFSRLYLVPGFGHSIGLFDMGADLLGMLDAWVCDGVEPQEFVAHERRYDRPDREVLVCPFPFYPEYRGGDPALASSYGLRLPAPE